MWLWFIESGDSRMYGPGTAFSVLTAELSILLSVLLASGNRLIWFMHPQRLVWPLIRFPVRS